MVLNFLIRLDRRIGRDQGTFIALQDSRHDATKLDRYQPGKDARQQDGLEDPLLSRKGAGLYKPSKQVQYLGKVA